MKRSTKTPENVPVRIAPAILKRVDRLVEAMKDDPEVEGRVSRSSAIRHVLLIGLRSAERKYGLGARRIRSRSKSPREAGGSGS
jgi:hypothetical protein